MVGKDGIDIILRRPDLISCSPSQVYSPCILTVLNFIPIRGYTRRDGVRTVPTKCTACLLWVKVRKRHEHKRKKYESGCLNFSAFYWNTPNTKDIWKYEDIQSQQNGIFLSKAFTKKMHSVTIIITQRKMQVQILNSLAFLMNSFKISNISNHYKYDYVMCQEEQIWKNTKLSLHILKFDPSMSRSSHKQNIMSSWWGSFPRLHTTYPTHAYFLTMERR